jgi:hypothetical protein
MKATTLVALALIGAGVAALGWRTTSDRDTIAAPEDALLRTAVTPVSEKLAGHAEDGDRLAAFYLAMTDVLRRDQGRVVENTAQLRELHRRAGLLMFQQTALVGKYPGLAESIDKILADHIGLDNVPLDAAKQKAAVDAFQAIAWACHRP